MLKKKKTKFVCATCWKHESPGESVDGKIPPGGNHGTSITQLSLSETQLCHLTFVYKKANGLDAVRAMETLNQFWFSH